MTTLSVLEQARSLVARGWCQHSYRHNDCYCLVGAVKEVCTLSRDRHNTLRSQAQDALRETARLREPRGSECGALLVWNDDLGRTQEEVVELFDATIARLKETK